MPPAPFDRNQVPSRDPGSNQEFIRLHSGTRRLVPEWDVAARAWKYTALGKRFFLRKLLSMLSRFLLLLRDPAATLGAHTKNARTCLSTY